MAVQIEIVCCDRLGRRLESRIVVGDMFSSTLKEREKATKELIERNPEPNGSEPFIFTNTRSI
jgi:hypothetical protein